MKNTHLDVVTGEEWGALCMLERQSLNGCGRQGKNFEPRPIDKVLVELVGPKKWWKFW